MSDVNEKIEELLKSNKVFLFMKGNPAFPQCGFSAHVVAILKELNIEFSSFNILEDETLRAAIKEYSSWPTFPQLYINSELIGGCDIITELYESKKLEALVN